MISCVLSAKFIYSKLKQYTLCPTHVYIKFSNLPSSSGGWIKKWSFVGFLQLATREELSWVVNQIEGFNPVLPFIGKNVCFTMLLRVQHLFILVRGLKFYSSFTCQLNWITHRSQQLANTKDRNPCSFYTTWQYSRINMILPFVMILICFNFAFYASWM